MISEILQIHCLCSKSIYASPIKNSRCVSLMQKSLNNNNWNKIWENKKVLVLIAMYLNSSISRYDSMKNVISSLKNETINYRYYRAEQRWKNMKLRSFIIKRALIASYNLISDKNVIIAFYDRVTFYVVCRMKMKYEREIANYVNWMLDVCVSK